MKKYNNERLVIPFFNCDKKALRIRAAQEGLCMADFVRDLILKSIEEDENKDIRSDSSSSKFIF